LVQMARIMKDLQHSPVPACGFLLPIVTVSSVDVKALHYGSTSMVVRHDTPLMRSRKQIKLYMRYSQVYLDNSTGAFELSITTCLRPVVSGSAQHQIPFHSKSLPPAGDPESAVISSKLSADLLVRT
jgi:hypothetical protein